MGAVPRWFQLYWSRDPEFNASVVRRAEVAGCSAIVVTLDTFLLAWRERDIQNAYLPFLLGQGLGNYFSDPAFRQALAQPPEQDPAVAIQHFLAIFSNPSLTWKDLAFLRERTQLPILLKGILHPDDALHAIDAGMDGIIVSNHGARQVAGAPLHVGVGARRRAGGPRSVKQFPGRPGSDTGPQRLRVVWRTRRVSADQSKRMRDGTVCIASW